MTFEPTVVDRVIKRLISLHGEAIKDRAERGVRQVAMFWRQEDGDEATFERFCEEHFVPDAETLKKVLKRFEVAFEALAGHEIALTRTLREPLDLDTGPNLPLDLLLGSLNPFDHLAEDLFKTKVAFAALLNFPLYTDLASITPAPSREEWAAIRLAQAFAMRIPGHLKQEVTRVATLASDYIDNYNIFTSALRRANGDHPFPNGPKLISHWGLRDHIKALYADPKGNLERQRLLQTVMERIITQEIPKVVINNPSVEWDPEENVVYENDIPTIGTQREPDTRYLHIIQRFKIEREIDKWSPLYPTFISRQFDYGRGMSEEAVEALLLQVLEDPVGAEVAALIRKRLGRPLEPFDIWYDGFKERGSIPEETLNKVVSERFPTLEAFAKALPQILESLGFSPDTALFLAERIKVDPARGAGHAMGAGMRTDSAHLRTRVPKGGMDYKGFNIAMHELGHTVEQTFSLYKVDNVLLSGVPNTAFTEAMAFMFQDRDLEVLGLGRADEKKKAMRALDVFWATREIAGVAIVDMRMWRWLYEHPDATPEALRQAVIEIAKDLWNRYYAPVLQTRPDSPLLAIYSHMIAYALYLPDYPIGHLIHFQVERFLEKEGKSLAKEMERMCVQGRIPPDLWMKEAVGEGLSARPLIESAREALSVLQ